MTIIITAFERSPDGGKGLARDTRVRWALEEVGQPYEVRLLSFRAMKDPAHRALHPFGQIPTYEEGDLALFETGAIVFHIAERHAGRTIALVTHGVEEAVFLATDLVVLAGSPARIALKLELDFGQRHAKGEAARAIKSLPEFIAVREQVLSAVRREEALA